MRTEEKCRAAACSDIHTRTHVTARRGQHRGIDAEEMARTTTRPGRAIESFPLVRVRIPLNLAMHGATEVAPIGLRTMRFCSQNVAKPRARAKRTKQKTPG